ncbi:ATP-dependent DNA helicase [Arsenophonus nasoniae]|uniref:ATP-dependent DNA helicase n=1 Tax=Arsenophonus nasoniae TaxID=638 RepID=UPI003879B3B6
MLDDFSIKGPLFDAIPGFRPRDAQIEMARAITTAIQSQQTLVVEAGTGTGKTYAYLVPALRSNKKVVISTGSKTLQDQLYYRDLPIIKAALAYSGHVALLKGRANYLCLERLEQQSLAGEQLIAEMIAEIVRLRSWAIETEDGDISHCHQVAEDSAVWPLVTSTNDNCIGSHCPYYQRCFVLKARKKALEADVVVVNHHLFMADKVVKNTGFGELIPSAEVIIFDEAHQIPDIASQYFGQQLSSRQLFDLARDIILVYRTEIRDQIQLQKCADSISQATLDFRLMLGENGFRGDLQQLLNQQSVSSALQRLEDALEFSYEVIKLSLGRSAALDAIFDRTTTYCNRLNRLKETTIPGFSYWFESFGRHFLLALTPLTVADKFHDMITTEKGSWIFTSATLAVSDKLSYFSQRLGLEKANSLILPSPFDYQRQTLLCVPRYLPDINQADFAEQLVVMLKPVIEHNQGRCFFLCTSLHMMRELTAMFRECLNLPVLMQGETSKARLLSQFTAAGNALLIATNSFWEGVDVKGDALSCVIIDRLPFTSPDEPLLRARMQDCQLHGGNVFYDVQLPDAVLNLKQGIGRLVRDVNDSGVIIICDKRLVSRPYGEVFLNSLPPSPRTRSLQVVINFLAKTPSTN